MRKTTTMLATMALLIALCAGAALAAQVACPDKGECRGSNQGDDIQGTDRKDKILALNGRDSVGGGGGNDTIEGGDGNDGGDQQNSEGVAPGLRGDDGDFYRQLLAWYKTNLNDPWTDTIRAWTPINRGTVAAVRNLDAVLWITALAQGWSDEEPVNREVHPYFREHPGMVHLLQLPLP